MLLFPKSVSKVTLFGSVFLTGTKIIPKHISLFQGKDLVKRIKVVQIGLGK